jgi:hypothetical protein
MNQTTDLPADDRTLDRLVDGELSPAEYDRALRSLDDQPDGWRRCALAFIEAQAWRRELGILRREDTSPTAPEVTVRPATARKRWPLLLAVAASFLSAFGLGLALRPFAATGPQAPVGVPLADGSARPDMPVESVDVKPTPLAPLEPKSSAPSGNVMFVMDHGDGSGSREVPVPVFDLSPENEQSLSREPLAPSSEMRRAFQRLGRDVRMQKHFIPLETLDGRHVVIPVEQMEITPAGRRAYQ